MKIEKIGKREIKLKTGEEEKEVEEAAVVRGKCEEMCLPNHNNLAMANKWFQPFATSHCYVSLFSYASSESPP